ncbi:MAG: hypothetical protein V3574_03285 [Candidatus Moraniibacteriota bacterium]
MSPTINSLQLNKKHQQSYRRLNGLIFFGFFLFFAFLAYKIIFPSQYFTYSFKNVNSLKNTITDLFQEEKVLSFFASTPANFSHVQITLRLEKGPLNDLNQEVIAQKSFKAFFYPSGENLSNLEGKEENRLSSIEDSVFIIGNQKQTPIDSPETLLALGYNWDNISENQVDLSSYEKQKLADLNASHPDGTIFKTEENSKFYFVENRTKRKLTDPDPEKIKNPITVGEESLLLKENCHLQKSKLSAKKYSCEIPLYRLNDLSGKDFRFELSNNPSELKIKNIDLEFRRQATWKNFYLFLADLKKKILYRFGFKN